MIGSAVYVLCALTSLLCAVLLLRAYHSRRAPLLLWSGAAFGLFTASNVMLFVDLVLVPSVDLSLVRNIITLFGIALLLRGLIWEAGSR